MKRSFIKILSLAAIALASTAGLSAQNSLPAPGAGGAPASPPGGGFGGPAGPPPPGPSWGGPWGASWNAPMVVNTVNVTPAWQNTGTTSVVGVGYDARGVWRTIPMTVQYNYNGVNYNVMVINAWDPWSQMWDYDVDTNAYSTVYYLRGTQYNYYTVLSTGTYYFNL